MENSSLLEKAKATRARASKDVSKDEEDLALAWLQGDVTTQQVANALGVSGATAAAYAMGNFLRSAYVNGRLRVVVPEEVK